MTDGDRSTLLAIREGRASYDKQAQIEFLLRLFDAQEQRWEALEKWYGDVFTIINVGTVGEKLRELKGGKP